MKKSKTKLWATLLNPIYYVLQAPYIYLTGYASGRGIPDGLLSTLIGFSFLAAFFGQFVWGYVADKIGSNRKIFIAGIALGLIDFLCLWFIPGNLAFAVAYMLLGFFQSPQASILDAWTLDLIDYDGKTYGSIKSIGAAGFAIAMLGMGFVIDGMGYIVLPIMQVVVSLMALAIAFILDDRQVQTVPKDDGGMKRVLTKPSFMYLLVTVFLLGCVIAPPNNLKILLLRTAGGSEANMGVDNFIGYAIQSALYYTAGRMNMKRQKLILSIAITTTLLGAVLLVNAPNIYFIYLSTALIYGAFSYENTILRFMAQEIAPAQYRTSALSMIDAAFMQLSGFAGLYGAGWLMNYTNLRGVMIACSIICAVSLVMSLFISNKRAAA